MNKRIEFFRNQIGKDKWQYEYPLMDWLKTQVVEVDEGRVKMQFTVEKYMLNPIGIMHGGIMATILDEVMGAASFTLGRPNGFATVNMNIDFLIPAKAADIIFGEGTVLRAGKTILHIKAELYKTDGTLVAKATSNMIRTAVQLPI
ncbi:MAG TPA: PaaI family thioesterase [Chitinophagales bacterium]|jgi:acyl-coenzyme A thioesterase 13|nr:PaaI family thioesterase [Chitinophagales bacterium]MBP6154266.1 PaaI family thioesterase [Chitinophagales bacterium]HQV78765.1 PaaI family thioesterase [Chitinophagales bacterium]HQW79131.1 PaaI family thioesterase [Chitinophagales bacterium]HRB67865.1 PaaI family thioesterase [Chitinophagales bacterium]